MSKAFAGKNTVEITGDVGQFAVPLSALGVSISKGDYEGARQMFHMSFATVSTTYGLKYALNCSRPDRGGLSFPSGHTATAFMGATFLHQRYGLASSIPAYFAASYVGFSRVYARRHYTVDVLAAAGIAYLASRFFTCPYSHKVNVVPVIEKDFYGFSLDTKL